MIESPLLDDLKVLFRQMGVQEAIVASLEDRFGSVPEDITSRVKAIRETKRLLELNRRASTCADLDDFRSQLASVSV